MDWMQATAWLLPGLVAGMFVLGAACGYAIRVVQQVQQVSAELAQQTSAGDPPQDPVEREADQLLTGVRGGRPEPRRAIDGPTVDLNRRRGVTA